MKILLTGNAGFIGFHAAKSLLERGDDLVGIDSINDYYDVSLKEARLNILKETAKETKRSLGNEYTFLKMNLANKEKLEECFKNYEFDRVIHLAAQAGVRYSLKNPHAYVESNIVSFVNLIESCRNNDVAHLTYASTSSVYGANTKMPFSEHHSVNHPLQFYAATKRSNELMAHSYSHLYGLPTSGLRFFTVYGPWGRPDMALFLFTKNIIEGKPIEVFNEGNHTRDFTFVDDIVKGVIKVSDQIARPNPRWDSNNPDPSSSNAPFRILNIGNNEPIKLSDYISAIESALGKKSIQKKLPLQAGDVPDTYADVSELKEAVGYKPSTNVQDGVRKFIKWYCKFYNL